MNNNRLLAPPRSTYTYFTANTFITVLAVVLCFYMLVYFYNQIKQAKKSLATPQITMSAMCPDYWDIAAPNICSNSKHLGSCRINEDTSVDFNDALFTDARTGDYMKCQWAKTCGVSWQNIDKLC